MPHYDEPEVTRLVREAFEEDELASETNHGEAPCGSYASLALLMTEAGSSFTSASHVANCATCQRMLARLLARRCPNTGVLKEYREPGSDLSGIAALGWHIAGCNWCELRLAFTPRAASDTPTKTGTVSAMPVHGESGLRALWGRPSMAVAYSAAVLAVVGCVWLGLLLKQERQVAANHEKQWIEANNRAEYQVQELTQHIQALSAQESTSQPQDNSTELVRTDQKPPPPPTIPLVATFALGLGSERGGNGLTTFRVPAKAARVRFRIPLSSNDYNKYRVILKKPEGQQVFMRDAVPIANKTELLVELPVSVLSDGDYIAYVTGVESKGDTKTVATYPMRFTHSHKP